MNRRDLFRFAGLTLLGQSCNFHPFKSNPNAAQLNTSSHVVINRETIFCGYRRSSEQYDHVDSGLAVCSAKGVKKINLQNEVHAIVESQTHNLKIFLTKLEKKSFYQQGSGEIKSFDPGEGNYFYGHGVVDEKENILYTTQSRITKDRKQESRLNEPGYLYAYSLPEMKFITRYSTFGNDPHDMKIVGSEIIVCNGGKNSNVAFIDLKSKKLIHSYTMDYPYVSLRHIDQVDHDNFVVAPLSNDSKKSCMLFLLNRQKGLRAWNPPEGVDTGVIGHQLLSVLVYKNLIFATCPDTNAVVVLGVDGQYIGAYPIMGASSLVISPENGGVLIGSGMDDLPLHLIKVEGRNLTLSRLNWGHGASRAHSYILLDRLV